MEIIAFFLAEFCPRSDLPRVLGAGRHAFARTLASREPTRHGGAGEAGDASDAGDAALVEHNRRYTLREDGRTSNVFRNSGRVGAS